ncbi:hypothetical protein CHS0354_030238 [Potamilus streckersoni]|uniref:Uncharacterized protein n=1 Tax=Potamilus streckersoni TaxID=2493646 RepID=A0AAE0RSZ7_9BIVA|nr:hypothetical protein CHS0354_030238 [Potamilus streckersoni]
MYALAMPETRNHEDRGEISSISNSDYFRILGHLGRQLQHVSNCFLFLYILCPEFINECIKSDKHAKVKFSQTSYIQALKNHVKSTFKKWLIQGERRDPYVSSNHTAATTTTRNMFWRKLKTCVLY